MKRQTAEEREYELEQKTNAVMAMITSGPGWTSSRIAYTMRDSKFLKIRRREELLKAKPIKWLRQHVAKVDQSKTKAQLVQILLAKQFSDFSMLVYEQVKMNRALRARKSK